MVDMQRLQCVQVDRWSGSVRMRFTRSGSRSNARPKVGEVVRVIPNHVCVVVNMVDRLIAVRGEKIVEVLPVAARGKLV